MRARNAASRTSHSSQWIFVRPRTFLRSSALRTSRWSGASGRRAKLALPKKRCCCHPSGTVLVLARPKPESIYPAPSDPLFFDACDRGGIGIRAGFRILWGNPSGFESRRSHDKGLQGVDLRIAYAMLDPLAPRRRLRRTRRCRWGRETRKERGHRPDERAAALSKGAGFDDPLTDQPTEDQPPQAPGPPRHYHMSKVLLLLLLLLLYSVPIATRVKDEFIAFTSDRDGNLAIYVMNATSTSRDPATDTLARTGPRRRTTLGGSQRAAPPLLHESASSSVRGRLSFAPRAAA